MEKVMKYLSPILKLALFILLLNNIGIFSINPSSEGANAPIKNDGGRADIQYLNEKIKRAESLGEAYGPEQYFADLTDIDLKRKANDFDRNAILIANQSIQTLLGLFHNNVVNCRARGTEEEQKAFFAQIEIGQKKHALAVDPEAFKKSQELEAEMKAPGYWNGVLISILLWLGSFYLKNLPLAFVLLVLWWYQEKDTFKITNPLSFILCLIIYPVIIARTWYRQLVIGGRTFALSVELKRRQTDVFSMISDDEIADLKRFAASNFKISDYSNYLDNRGLKRQHALLPLIFLTVIVLLPKIGMTALPENIGHDIVISQEINAPPNQIDDAGAFSSMQTALCATLSNIFIIFYFFTTEEEIFILQPGLRSGFKKNPDPIPALG